MHLTAKDRLTFKMLMAPPVQLSWCKHQMQLLRTNWTWQSAPKSSNGWRLRQCVRRMAAPFCSTVSKGINFVDCQNQKLWDNLDTVGQMIQMKPNHCILHIALQPLCCRRPCDHKKDAQLQTHPVHPVVAGHQGLALICTIIGKTRPYSNLGFLQI